ncbi:O-fucosyltransferase 27 [Ranunculus cassubicifolius]
MYNIEKKNMFFKSKLKWVALLGLILSAASLFTHFLLARYTGKSIDGYQAFVTIFSWRPIFENNADLSSTGSRYMRLWGPVRRLETLHPYANPRGNYEAPNLRTNGYIFIRIQGGFHEIRNSICDVVVVARLLNATLVIPEVQSTTSSKGISSGFKSFAYLYNEDQFIMALAKDVRILKTLPKTLKWARRKKEIPSFRVPYSTSPDFYLNHVLPVLKRHSVVELVVSGGGCLQAILPPNLEEFQRLRCRVAFHALQFRHEIQQFATTILNRLRASGRPYIAYDPGLTRDALAYHGCSELFQDVHSELIQVRRAWMIKRHIVKEKLLVNSVEKHLNGSCPLMPEEIGLLLRAYGYSSDTIIYLSGGEVFGGQRTLIPLHAMFDNVVDRTSLSTIRELTSIYGHEGHLVGTSRIPPRIEEKKKREAWNNLGPRPRPLPPPPARNKYPYNMEGWWGWVAVDDDEPDSTIDELRTNAHKLLWEAIDYVISVEADVFISGFDVDGKGHPNSASLVMGQRLYQSAALKSYRPDRKEVAKLLDEIRDDLYQANRTWLSSIRKQLTKSVLDGLTVASKTSKPLSFLSHPIPECSCMKHVPSHASSPSSQTQIALGVHHRCPAWMNLHEPPYPSKENEDLDEEDPISELFLWHGNNNHEVAEKEIIEKEVPMEDQEELENGER